MIASTHVSRRSVVSGTVAQNLARFALASVSRAALLSLAEQAPPTYIRPCGRSLIILSQNVLPHPGRSQQMHRGPRS